MKDEELQRTDENFKQLMKDDSGKMILSFLLASILMPKEELEKLLKSVKGTTGCSFKEVIEDEI